MNKRVVGSALLVCMFWLTACSSKPDAADIKKDLTEVHTCPILELSDVRKVDGGDVDGNLYDVAFTYTVSIKGGKEVAAKLFAENSFLVKQLRLARMAHERAMSEAIYSKGDGTRVLTAAEGARISPAVKEAADRVKQIETRLSTLVPCTGIWDTSHFSMTHDLAEEAAKSGQEKVTVPISIKMTSTGRMRKSESGWHFIRLPVWELTNTVYSEPVAYPRFDLPAATAKAESIAEVQAPPAKLAAIDATPDDPVVAPSPASTQGPSFDCANASTHVEKTICADPKLAALDAKTVNAYKEALAKAADKDTFKKAHASWRKNIRDACADVTCIATAYQKRLADFK